MIKKILLSLAMFGFVFGSPILASAQSFTSLKTQMFDLGQKIENFKIENKGEVLGVTSSYNLSFTASPYNVSSGGSSEFKWSVSPAAESCVAWTSQNNPQWQGNKNPSGTNTQTITNITKNETFRLECTWADGGKNSRTFFIQIKENLPQITFTATPVEFSSSPFSTTLSWKATNATECSYGGVSGAISAFQQWPVPTSKGIEGTQVITNLDSYSTFRLNCEGPGGYAYKEVLVYLVPTINFTANPTTVPYLGSTLLSWNTENAYQPLPSSSYCVASKDWSGNKNFKGTQVISGIKTDKTFVLTCYDVTGKAYSKTVYVKVAKVGDIPDPDKETGGLGSDGPGLVSNNPEVSKITSNNTCSTFSFKRTLSYGSKDTRTTKDVTLMQSILVDEGLMRASDATGSFFSRTQLGLRAFQKKYNLTQTGRLDTKTMVKMNDLFKEYCSN
jgi:hypothetical protein